MVVVGGGCVFMSEVPPVYHQSSDREEIKFSNFLDLHHKSPDSGELQ